MPADSEVAAPLPVALPHTWRPFGVRVTLLVVGAVMAVLVAAVSIGLRDEVRGQITASQLATLALIAAMLVGTYYGLVRCKLVATETGLTVVNGYRTRRLEWSQLIGLSLPRGAPWATLDLSDGTVVSVMAIQGSDGARARRAVEEVCACITAHTPD